MNPSVVVVGDGGGTTKRKGTIRPNAVFDPAVVLPRDVFFLVVCDDSGILWIQSLVSKRWRALLANRCVIVRRVAQLERLARLGCVSPIRWLPSYLVNPLRPLIGARAASYNHTELLQWANPAHSDLRGHLVGAIDRQYIGIVQWIVETQPTLIGTAIDRATYNKDDDLLGVIWDATDHEASYWRGHKFRASMLLA